MNIFRSSLMAVALLSFAPMAVVATEQTTEAVQQATYEERFERIVQQLAQCSAFIEAKSSVLSDVDNIRKVVAFCQVIRSQLFDLMSEASANLTPERAAFAQRLLAFTKSEFYTDLVQQVNQLLERIKELESQNS